jgi:hypothetical protein
MSSSLTIAEIKARARIADVWLALGGPELKGRRGVGFWRGGSGLSVSVDLEKGVWYDHVDAQGGGVVELVMVARGCDFRAALAWLADFTSMDLCESSCRSDNHPDSDWKGDLERATYWAMIAEMLTEDALESLPFYDPQRYGLTMFLRAIRLGAASMVDEYRRFRSRQPQLAAGMVREGRRHDARLQRRLALWLVGRKSA